MASEKKNKLFYILKKNIFKIILLLFCVLLCLIIKYNFMDSVTRIDSAVRNHIDFNIRCSWLTPVMKVITEFGGVIGIISVCILSLILFKKNSTRVLIICNISTIGVLCVLLKAIFNRERAAEALIKMPITHSFPSGHTFFSVGFYGFVIYLILVESNINKTLKIFIASLASLIILLIMFSRLYLGVHYFTDILGGLIFSLLVLSIYISTHKILRRS